MLVYPLASLDVSAAACIRIGASPNEILTFTLIIGFLYHASIDSSVNAPDCRPVFSDHFLKRLSFD